MKATDGEELRNKISKDFEMVGEVGRTGVRSSCWTSTTHEHIVFRKKLCKRVLGMHELVVIPSSKESGTLPSPTMTTLFLFVCLFARSSLWGRLNSKAQAKACQAAPAAARMRFLIDFR